jgi:hypothetical protein
MSRDRIQLIPGLFLLFIASGVSAQPVLRCDFDTQMAKISPASREAIEEEIAHGYSNVLKREVITLPIVFHVVYTSSEENISDLQIRSQIDILNRDFAYMSDNAPGVPAEFTHLGGDSGIRFCLASRDPNGNPTSGITRTMTQVSRIGSRQESNGRRSIHYDIYGGKDGWDPEHYINVWVGDLDGLLGQATFPGMAPQPEEDGVIIDPEFVGALGLAAQSDPFDRGHTLTHELGHYFGLFHIWGQGNGGCDTDDLVEDTPEQEFPYLDCPEYPQFSCSTSDMFMNFMDFTNDRCLAIFTKGQNARMQTVLMGLRASLLENADACTPPDGGEIQLEDVQLFYAPTSRQIVIALETESIVQRGVSLYAVDGRLIHRESWTTGSTFWLNTEGIPAGVYVLRLESGGEGISRKMVVN